MRGHLKYWQNEVQLRNWRSDLLSIPESDFNSEVHLELSNHPENNQGEYSEWSYQNVAASKVSYYWINGGQELPVKILILYSG